MAGVVSRGACGVMGWGWWGLVLKVACKSKSDGYALQPFRRSIDQVCLCGDFIKVFVTMKDVVAYSPAYIGNASGMFFSGTMPSQHPFYCLPAFPLLITMVPECRKLTCSTWGVSRLKVLRRSS